MIGDHYQIEVKQEDGGRYLAICPACLGAKAVAFRSIDIVTAMDNLMEHMNEEHSGGVGHA